MKATSMLAAFACLAITATAYAASSNPNPYAKADNTWISISGEVSTVSPDSFELNYGDGYVTVEMDDWDIGADGYTLLKGDRVTVNGIIDDDLYETTSIEASSVYVENISTYFYADSGDEKDASITVTAPLVMASTVVQGEVTDVQGRDFIIDTGGRALTVDTSSMDYNPLDNKGFQKIKPGDQVTVTGNMDLSFFGRREIDAHSVVTLNDG